MQKIKKLSKKVLEKEIEKQNLDISLVDFKEYAVSNKTIVQLFLVYKGYSFQIVCNKLNEGYIVHNITTFRSFIVAFPPSSAISDIPVSLKPSISLDLQSIESFPFDLERIQEVCDKMISTEITFKEVGLLNTNEQPTKSK